MKCERCLGPMVSERVLYKGRIFMMWKCVMCGEIVDWLIKLNRAEPARVQAALENQNEPAFHEAIRRPPGV